MPQHLVALGHGVALIDLEPVVPQPRTPGIIATQRSYGLTGLPHDMGEHIPWIWGSIGNKTLYDALLAQLGLDNPAVKMASLTVSTRGYDFEHARFNITIARPENNVDVQWNIFPRNLTLYLTRIKAL